MCVCVRGVHMHLHCMVVNHAPNHPTHHMLGLICGPWHRDGEFAPSPPPPPTMSGSSCVQGRTVAVACGSYILAYQGTQTVGVGVSLCGWVWMCVGVWVCGCVGVWVCGCVGVRGFAWMYWYVNVNVNELRLGFSNTTRGWGGVGCGVGGCWMCGCRASSRTNACPAPARCPTTAFAPTAHSNPALLLLVVVVVVVAMLSLVPQLPVQLLPTTPFCC